MTKSFEEKLEELEKLVKQLESDNVINYTILISDQVKIF